MSDEKYTEGQRRAYEEGKAAKKSGGSLTDNPYPLEGFDEHASFNAGFGAPEEKATTKKQPTKEKGKQADESAANNAAVTAAKEAERTGSKADQKDADKAKAKAESVKNDHDGDAK